MSNKQHAQVLILGSGPAGYTAAVYAARANLAPLVIEGEPSSTSDQPGGQLMLTTEVENYPGFPDGIMGPDLMINFRAQAERFGAEFLTVKATRVDFTERPFRVWVHDSLYVADAIIVSTGAQSLMLGLPAEARAAMAGLAHRFDLALVALTRGPGGSLLFADGAWSDHPGVPVEVHDTVGAGDAFTAALTSRLLARQWAPVDEADVRFAMAAGALATTKAGAWPGLPTADAVADFLAEHDIDTSEFSRQRSSIVTQNISIGAISNGTTVIGAGGKVVQQPAAGPRTPTAAPWAPPATP